jgi:hypothetical protein
MIKVFKSLPKISYLYSLILTLISIVMFLGLSLREQLMQVIFLDLSFNIKFESLYYIVSESLYAMELFTSLLFILWTLTIYVFYTSLIAIIIMKRKSSQNKLNIVSNNNIQNSFFGFLSFIFSFISFGCVACGQALLFSILTLFVTTISIGLAHAIANLIMTLAIALLFTAIYKNYKILQNPNICPLS